MTLRIGLTLRDLHRDDHVAKRLDRPGRKWHHEARISIPLRKRQHIGGMIFIGILEVQLVQFLVIGQCQGNQGCIYSSRSHRSNHLTTQPLRSLVGTKARTVSRTCKVNMHRLVSRARALAAAIAAKILAEEPVLLGIRAAYVSQDAKRFTSHAYVHSLPDGPRLLLGCSGWLCSVAVACCVTGIQMSSVQAMAACPKIRLAWVRCSRYCPLIRS